MIRKEESMKKRQIFAIFVTSAVAFSVLAGCTDPQNPPGPPVTDDSTWHSLETEDLVEITLAGRDADTEKANYQQVVNDFNETHDNIVVHLEWWSDGTAYNIALDGMGKNLPDVFMLNDMSTMSFAASGKLANIRDHIDEAILSDLYPTAYEAYYFDHETKKKEKTENAGLYGLPKDQGPYGLAINEDLLRAKVSEYNAGASEAEKIDIDRVMSTTDPMKFDYFLDIGEKLVSVMGSNQYVCTGFDIQSTVYSNNSTFFSDDSCRTLDLTSDNFVGALQFIQDMYKRGIMPAAGTVTSGKTVFTAGSSIFYYTDAGPWQTKDFWQTCDFTWNILPMICGTAEGAISTSCVGGMSYSISNNCKYKDAALELVKYLVLDPTSQRTQYKRGQCIPNLVSMAQEYATDQYGFIAQQTGVENPCPANRGVWIDIVDGAGSVKTAADGSTFTDKITGRVRVQCFTPDSMWYTTLSNFIAGTAGSYGAFWKPKSDGTWVDIKEALEAYTPDVQFDLDDGWNAIDML